MNINLAQKKFVVFYMYFSWCWYDFEYMWWKLAVESRKSSLSALDFIFSYIYIYICSNASINLQPQIILINYSQYHKVVYKYQSYWWTVNKSYLWRIKKNQNKHYDLKLVYYKTCQIFIKKKFLDVWAHR